MTRGGGNSRSRGRGGRQGETSSNTIGGGHGEASSSSTRAIGGGQGEASSSSTRVDIDSTADTCVSVHPRQAIWIENRNIMPSSSVTTKNTLIFKQAIASEGVAWKFVPDERKQQYFEELKKYFTWDPLIDNVIYELWFKKAAKGYSQMIYRMRQNKTHKPACVPERVWLAWLATWNSNKAQEISRIARRNRMSEPDGPGTGISTHRGGSRCAQQHAKCLVKEKGIAESEVDWEVFLRLHCKNGAYSSQRDARIAEEVRKKADDELRKNPSVPVDMNRILVDVVGGISKKNRIYGLGSRSHVYCTPGGSSSHVFKFEYDVVFRQKVTEMEERMQKEMDERTIEVETRLRAQIAEQQMLIEEQRREMEEQQREIHEQRREMHEQQEEQQCRMVEQQCRMEEQQRQMQRQMEQQNQKMQEQFESMRALFMSHAK